MTKRIRYIPFVMDEIGKKEYQSNNFVPQDIAVEQKKAFSKIINWVQSQSNNSISLYDFLKQKLKIREHEDFSKMLSYEQMDAVLMAIYNLENCRPTADFVIGDTMGNGKGRILATIARYAFINNRNIMFFTITEGLFSAFYEDLKNVGALQFFHDDIFIMHGDANIYDGTTLVQSSYGTKALNEMYKSGKPYINVKGKRISIHSQLLFSTYSQINSEKTFSNKFKVLKHFVNEDTIYLFDEFHKSIGESTTKESRQQIMSLGGSSIRSSATFMSKYEHLCAYLSLFDLSPQNDKLAILAYKNNTDLQLNAHIARHLTRNVKLIRRENERSTQLEYTELPESHRVVLEKQLTHLRRVVYKMFDCFQCAKNQTTIWTSKWSMFGGLITRLSNILILHGKRQYLIEMIEESLSKNQKVLIILESTFESNIEQAIELQEKIELLNNADDETGELLKSKIKMNHIYKGLDFSSLLMSALFNLFENLHHKLDSQFDTLFNEAIDLIQEFPYVPLSFIDDVIDHFQSKNENVLEISGRTYHVHKKFKNGEWEYLTSSKPKEDKALIAHKFNNGWVENGKEKNANIIILTQSGFTGISLHAHYSYKDQRQRKLIEAQLSNKEAEREQAMGRPDRLGQTSIPELTGLSSGILFERRQITLNDNKAHRMRSFTSNVVSTHFNIYNDLSNKAILSYLLSNPSYAKLIGIYTDYGIKSEPYYYLDMVLKRSLLYSNKTQNYLNNVIDMASQTHFICEVDYNEKLTQTFVEDVKFSNIKEVWRLSSTTDKQHEMINNLTKTEIFNTTLPVVYQVKATNEIRINKNNVEQMRNELLKHYNEFKTMNYTYQEEISKIVLHPEIYPNESLDRLKTIENLKVGNQIIFKYKGNTFTGYVNQIQFGFNEECQLRFPEYASNYLYEIVLTNPNYSKINNRILADKIWVSAETFLMEGVVIINKKIDWDKYKRNGELVQQESLMLVGNMFYLNLIKQVFGINQSVTLSKNMPNSEYPDFIYALRLPNKTDINDIPSLLLNTPLIVDVKQALNEMKEGYIRSLDNFISIQLDTKINKYISVGYLFAIHKSLLDEQSKYFDKKMQDLLNKDISKQVKQAKLNCINQYPIEEYSYFKLDISNSMKLMYYLFFKVNEINSGQNRFYIRDKFITNQ